MKPPIYYWIIDTEAMAQWAIMLWLAFMSSVWMVRIKDHEPNRFIGGLFGIAAVVMIYMIGFRSGSVYHGVCK